MLSLLRCPLTHQPLRYLNAVEAAALGCGDSEILLREDGATYYRFDEHGFPILLPESARSRPGSPGTGAAGAASLTDVEQAGE
jgi:uncharacterized protein YbaR (Trm112 family)